MFYTISCFFRESAYGQSIDIINTEQKTYYYTNDWRDTIVDSSQFHTRSGHENPKEFPIKNRIQIANHVLVGGYELGEAAKDEINNYIEITSDTRPEDPAIKLHSGIYYHCNDVFNPEIGDIRLQFLTAGIEGNFVRITRNAHKHNSCGTHLSMCVPSISVHNCRKIREQRIGALCYKYKHNRFDPTSWKPYIE